MLLLLLLILLLLLLLLLFFCPEVLHSPRHLETIRRINAILELPSLVPTKVLKSAPKSNCIKLLSANGKALEKLVPLARVTRNGRNTAPNLRYKIKTRLIDWSQ